MQSASLREVVKSDWFAGLDILLVILGGIAWMFFPEYFGILPILFLLLPWILRFAVKEFPFRRTSFDWLMFLFLLTVWVGYWASYDKDGALNKAWLLTTSVFLYYALSAQPEQNLSWVALGLFVIGVGVSFYFFLTYNFVDEPRKVEWLNSLGILWSSIRPHLPWTSIHPNYAAGVAVVTGIFGLYPWRKFGRYIPVRSGIVAGYIVIAATLVMATSRGAWMALASAAGVWFLWKWIDLNGNNFTLGKDALFPIQLFFYLCVVVAVLYLGPARQPSSIVGSTDFGLGCRFELFGRSLYFIGDYPITGGGLSSFPGLYSEYILDIPYFYVINSHNLFLDVFIEQGIFGGMAFFLFFLIALWRVSRAIVRRQASELWFFQWLVLCALVMAFIHGMVDDYLYNAKGSFLSLFLIGLSMAVTRDDRQPLLKYVLPRRYAYGMLVGILLLAGFFSNSLRAIWYANLGAVQLAKDELRGFPETGWMGCASATQFEQAETSLRTALELDPSNRTANHRLGLIYTLRQDFSSAVSHLEIAYDVSPQHRGIVKSLGFDYAWLGETDLAVSSLKGIPEAKNELDAYSFWWLEQGRVDLSEKASELGKILQSLDVQR